MDIHPLQVTNTVLTDNLNGTFITYNGNEYSLQNDMGNFKLKNCKLKPGYLPIGTASYADTIYILSYNPIDDNVELGSYPSPVQYSDSKTSGNRQLLGVLENYLRGYIAAAGLDNIEEPIIVNWEILNSYVDKVTFDDSVFKLKSGDEYILNITSSEGLCGFEDLSYKVIFDSGKSQTFSIKQNEYDFTPVPWNTPGHIEISNHLFKIDQNSFKITSKRTYNSRFEISALYELFITDEAFIKKLDSEKDTIFVKESPDYINFDVKIDNISGVINKITVEPWLGEYRKIKCAVKFEIPRTDNTDMTLERKVTVRPEFMTNFKVSSESEHIPSKFYKVCIILNEHCIDYNLSLSDISNERIGSSEFYWTGSNTLIVSGLDISDSQPYYKIDKLTIVNNNVVINNDRLWQPFVFNSSGKAELPTPVPGCDNNIYIWTFGRRNIISEIDIRHLVNEVKTEEITQDSESDWWIIKDGEKWYLKSEYEEQYNLIWGVYGSDDLGLIVYKKSEWILLDDDKKTFVRNENIEVESQHVMLNYDYSKMEQFWSTIGVEMYDSKRFDKIPFEIILSDWANEEFGITEPSVEITSNDNSLFELYGEKMNSTGAYYKYFKRFVNSESNNKNGIFYPSIVPVNFFNGEDKTTSSFEIPRKINLTVNLNNFKRSLNTFLGLTSDKIGTKIKYIERKDVPNCTPSVANLTNDVVFSNVNLWNKIDGQVSQLGDTFYFTDNLQYYKLKCNPVESWSSFYTVNKDQDGEMKEYTVDFSIDGYNFLWKSLDVNNYRAIRIGYPNKNPSDFIGKTIGNSNEYGCRQIDFYGQIHKNASLWNWSNLKIPGMCQYISNFHKDVRAKLDENWKQPVLVNADSKSELGLCQSPEGSYQGCISKLSATTFYRDKAQRASFVNDGSVTIIPNWDKWKKDESGEGDGDDRHYTAYKYFITLPMYCSNNSAEKTIMKSRKWDDKNIYETMTHVNDWEDWWLISSSEQHSYPHYDDSNIEFAGIGLVGQNDTTDYLDYYVAWIPGWEDLPESEQKYKLCSQTTIKFSPNWMHSNDGTPDWCGTLSININNDVFSKIKTTILSAYPRVENPVVENTDIVLFHQDIWTTDVWDVNKLEDYINKLTMYCNDDYNSLTSHPIFKTFIKTRGSAPARIVKFPVAGIYPTVASSIKDAFSGINEFRVWRKFYVDGNGRPFIINRESEKDIYVCKNANKKLFGYFPYSGNL